MKISLINLFTAALIFASNGFAQTAPKGDKGEKGEKVEKKEITIEKKVGTTKEKTVIVIDGSDITINGKPAQEYKGKGKIIIDDDIVINGNVALVPGKSRNMTITTNSNRPLLGVTTEKSEGGVTILSVVKASGADKAGLKEGDLITVINKTDITTPQQLSEMIGRQKPGDVLDIGYTRQGKPYKVKATLGKNEETYTINEDGDYNFSFSPRYREPFAFSMPRMPEWDAEQFKNLYLFETRKPKFGLSIQDDEDNRGVVVTDVEDESNAFKAGLKEDDIITELDGEKVKGVDDFKSALDSKKEQPSVALKVLREGKTENITLKVPRKIKSASL